ncbi:DUF3142 domain-containing protein [Commensalibacter oyaizuii]|uniref:DUF3142 domain-containing protein n=1 Tax=Commensalibacter oyaizuii TaxID=3043873 RepID=A0ABT6Q368_9PROT|nr:DUF3142 domain-containing protein [Commensalibacter sp. TBRC 16381]MDI2091553.1 DUF3142 domain-containing protein [Commensalibacter sp. TBRC 16381]
MRNYTITLIHNILKITCFVCLLCLSQSTHTHRVLPQQAYIWQKRWLSTLIPSIQQSTPYLTGWRFLAGEYEPDETTIYPSIDFTTLNQTQLPLTAVYRFDRIRPLPTAGEILKLVKDSPTYHQHHIYRIELDLDWPTLKLQHYISLLKTIKQQLPKNIYLTITVIPDWLNSPYFPQLTQQINHAILQVHTVDNPTMGLINIQNALRYIDKMNRISKRPFYVALPTYGLRVGMNSFGSIYYIEGENNLKAGPFGHELYSDPQQLRKLIQQLEQNPPFQLKGIIWFRLPVTNDQRNWSLRTWLTMLQHLPLIQQFSVDQIPHPNDPKLLNIRLTNIGNTPLELPKIIPLQCSIADGFTPYRFTTTPSGNYVLKLNVPSARPLNTNQQLIIGWMRCDP